MKRVVISPTTRWISIGLAGLVGLLVLLRLTMATTVAAAPDTPEISASPVHAGCYLARADRCKIHVEPFTINVASGQKLALFRLIAIRSGTGVQTMIYDFRPDQSNPVPATGTTYTPSRVAKDFAATCGESYQISLQGRDTGDTNVYNLGITDQFTCPSGTSSLYLPTIRKN